MSEQQNLGVREDSALWDADDKHIWESQELRERQELGVAVVKKATSGWWETGDCASWGDIEHTGGGRIGESQNTWVVEDMDTENKERIKKNRQGEKEREKEEEEEEREAGSRPECEVLKVGLQGSGMTTEP